MAKAQLDLQHVIANPHTPPFILYTGDPLLFCDTLTGIPLLFVPELRKLAFTSLYSLTQVFELKDI